MKILIAGGAGFIGRHLTKALLAQGENITVVSRDIKKIINCFKDQVESINWHQLKNLDANEFDVVINLVGENIGNKRWSKTFKKIIKESRTQAAQSILDWCNNLTKPIRIYNASAIGIYGLNSPQIFSEESAINWEHPTDFLSEVGQAWEKTLLDQKNLNIKIVFLRFAPVLHHSEGVLKKMLPLFKLGLGGPIGNGKQPFSWIHLTDAIRAIQFLLKHPEIEGPVNICAPQSAMQAEFAKTLGKVLHRPAILPTPAWVLKLIFGQMAKELLLSGQAVYPKKLIENHFEFLYPTLFDALKKEKFKYE